MLINGFLIETLEKLVEGKLKIFLIKIRKTINGY